MKTSTTLARYILVAVVFFTCTIITAFDAFVKASCSFEKIVVLSSSLLLECIGFLYVLIPDIHRTITNQSPQFIFEHDPSGIPFVDREELLSSVLNNIGNEISSGKNFCTVNIRYDKSNGKTAFANRLCYELQEFKNKAPSAKKVPQISPRDLGNIVYVNYQVYTDSFESYVKTNYFYIKKRKNIIVVDNSSGKIPDGIERLRDKDIFFVFLNYNVYADDSLSFTDDKIELLLNQLKGVIAFKELFEGKKDSEISSMASKLGELSNNNIGNIVSILSSSEFKLLLQTDKTFVDFYFAIRSGNYKTAEKLYEDISQRTVPSKIILYKIKYEGANLVHFLGNYKSALDELEQLDGEIINNFDSENEPILKSYRIDILLLKTHILKHMGSFDQAARELNNIPFEQNSLRWLRAHFSINILQINQYSSDSSDRKNILAQLSKYMSEFKQRRTTQNSDYYYYETYHPIVAFYQSNCDINCIPELLEEENCAIDFYDRNEQRYKTNCYFIKAELYRHCKNWIHAEENYQYCYNMYCYNGDKDILYLLAITCIYIQLFDHVKLNIPFDWDKALLECRKNESYYFHNRLISQFEEAKVDLDCYHRLENHYRTTINPIP